MRNIKIILQYIGTNYCGFQKQDNGTSIQELLEKSIFDSFNEKVKTYPSGRTDSGVHAVGQVVNFFIDNSVDVKKIPTILNLKLPGDIRVVDACEVDENFNSRKSAKAKTYVYKIYTGNILSAFDYQRALKFNYKIDIDKMNKACCKLIGTHDFSAFCSIKTTAKTTIRAIYDAHFERDGEYLIFSITGNGFLYNMVRIIVGTLLEIGQGKRQIESIEDLFVLKDRTKAGKTVKPDGLYLKEVIY